jgi:hypothetical protein
VVLVLGLAAAGCGSREPGSGSTPHSEPPPTNVKPETAEQSVERVGGFGITATVYDRYRVGTCLVGSVASPHSETEISIALCRVGSDEPLPDELTVKLGLASDTLPSREFTIPVGQSGQTPEFQIWRHPNNSLGIRVINAWGVTKGEPKYYFPLGTHKIQVRIGLDGKETVTLPDMLYLKVGKPMY